ncbi:hypothetical protein AKJ16_DCAP15172 [Drosera capensis]
MATASAELAPAEVDEDGKEINNPRSPHMSSAPWYRNGKRPKTGRDDSKHTPFRHPDMRAPKLNDSLSWGRRKTQNTTDADLIPSTVKKDSKDISVEKLDKISEVIPDSEMDLLGKIPVKDKQPLCVNQLVAKALQLRVKGHHEEADKLIKEAESVKSEQEVGERSKRPRAESSRYAMQDAKARQR